MKFCADCGKTLAILNNSQSNYCNSCTQKKKAAEKQQRPWNNTVNPSKNLPPNILLSYENGKILLKSEEGWLLWSGSSQEVHRLDHALARGEKILAIRRKNRE